ncbi:hypothetical protein I6H91_01765 [Micrococcus luteus]|uniref:HEPN domain-containing protein n=1 Tax=Micrococcus luteus TaxID=1270 RepID=UPI0019100344|nr:HEPN domain-containing protein [Micrococcus luteus]QQE49091.1 hypothetical protein I6H91_01765 [Micrococcus luteus]
MDCEPDDKVLALFEEYENLQEDLVNSMSGLAAINRRYGPHLVVAAASSLEDKVKLGMPLIIGRRAGVQLADFAKFHVFARKYHTLFEWNQATAAPFFASFGGDCKARFRSKLTTDERFNQGHGDFMSLGQERNTIVHNNFAAQTVSSTPEEIVKKYKNAVDFIACFEDLIFGAD